MSLTRAVFIRLIAAIYLMAFLSISVQMLGLYGTQGISPISTYLSANENKLGIDVLLSYPTVFWFDSSDGFLTAVPMIGAVCSLLALIGVLTGPMLVITWLLYLSIVTAGQEFMSFQWDILLLETGFLSIFFASWRPLDFLFSLVKEKLKLPSWTIDRVTPSVVLVWLFRWLLFRLMFQSGLVKLESGDETWHNLTAMTYHYFTQPLPTPAGWFAQQLPTFVQILSTGSVFFIELLVPLLIFCGRKARVIAAVLLILLQVLILLTGNYCFFNWLTIALCLLLLDDAVLFKMLSKTFSQALEKIEDLKCHKSRNFAIIPLAVLIVSLSMSRGLLSAGGAGFLPLPLYAVMSACLPWHLVSGYGLFAVMTTTRPEITVEGSADGIVWKEYTFKYKPGPLDRAPPIVAPHQPRLDWQMWFAALGTAVENQWLISFSQRLLSNSPEVLKLLETNPFPDQPPKYVRAIVYDYQMTDLKTLIGNGRWWKKTYKGNYLPAISKDGIAF